MRELIEQLRSLTEVKGPARTKPATASWFKKVKKQKTRFKQGAMDRGFLHPKKKFGAQGKYAPK